jgi:2-polyprenyl-6-methoxyphenol hydroxylase-like FAD-dependent oxidoreductase
VNVNSLLVRSGTLGPVAFGTSRSLTRTGLRDSVAGTPTRLRIEVLRMSSNGGVTLSHGTYHEYDLVVGADGIDSAVRRMVFGGTEPRFLNQV